MLEELHDTATRGPSGLQLIMREVNVRIFEIGTRLTSSDDRYSFVCECGDRRCARFITLELHRFDPTMPAGSLLAHVPDIEQEPLSWPSRARGCG